jgi:hypothetical protein
VTIIKQQVSIVIDTGTKYFGSRKEMAPLSVTVLEKVKNWEGRSSQ